MNRTLAYSLLALAATLGLIIAAARPDWASDQNEFLKNFVNHEFLNLLGVILAITLASVANIHLEFNKIEEKAGFRALFKSRNNLRKVTYWLVSLFMVAVALVVIKPIACGGKTAEAIFNSAALVIVLWHILILIAIIQLVFVIEPDLSQKATGAPPPPQSPPNTGQKTPP